MQNPIDFRSDTVTRPSKGMLEAMMSAEVGDDVFSDDPTVNRLQERVAELLGKEASVFAPSGTMANQIALYYHTSPGDEVYCEAGCHARNYEAGAPAFISGAMLCPIQGKRGAYTVEDVEPLIRPADEHFPPSRLIWIENTANRAGGAVFPQHEILRLREFADKHGLGFHLDGARIWNAAAATGKSEKELAAPFDTVNACFSKGMGCPVGSITAGSKEYFDKARRIRKRLGGGMRQAGILAAAALYAIENNRRRMADDHRRARIIAETIAEHTPFEIDLEAVQSNIVIFNAAPSGKTGEEAAQKLGENRIRCIPFGDAIRMVTHLDIDEEDVEHTVKVFKEKF